MTPDMAPILSDSEVEGYYMDCGWGYFGFKSGPVTGRYMAQWMATEVCPALLKPFSFRRFREYNLQKETAAIMFYTPWN